MLDFTRRSPYTGPSFTPTRCGPRRPASYTRNSGPKRLRLSQADARIGGHGYADGDYRTPAHR